jgi:hypothetical protein
MHMAATTLGGWQKVLYGLVKIFIKPYAEGNDPVTANAADWSNWKELSLIAPDGMSYKLNRKGKAVTVQALGQVDDQNAGEDSAQVQCAIEQSCLEAMQYAMAGLTYTAGAVPGTNPNTLGFGGGSESFYQVAFEGENLGGQTMIYHFPKCKATGALDQKFKVGEVAVTPYEWTAMVDPSRPEGERVFKAFELTEA